MSNQPYQNQAQANIKIQESWHPSPSSSKALTEIKMASIRNFMICAGVLLLAAHYSIGNPVPRHRRSDQNQALETTCPEWTRPDTNSTLDSATQITNGISVYRRITPAGGPVLSEPSLVCIINIASEYILFNNLVYLFIFCSWGSRRTS